MSRLYDYICFVIVGLIMIVVICFEALFAWFVYYPLRFIFMRVDHIHNIGFNRLENWIEDSKIWRHMINRARTI